MSKLELVLVTYNHSELVEKVLSAITEYVDNYDFTLSIHDSSKDDAIQKIIEALNNDKFSYYKYDSSINVDEKTMIALSRAQAEFVYLCGDGYIPYIDKLFSAIDSMGNTYNVVTFYPDGYCFEKEFYDDKIEFIKLHFASLILYGGSIFRNSILRKENFEECIAEFTGTGFSYPALLSIYASGPYIVRIGKYYQETVKGRISGWMKNKTAIEVWAKNLYEMFLRLKNILNFTDDILCSMIDNSNQVVSFLTFKGLIYLRVNNNYSFRLYRKYKYYLKRRRGCSMFLSFLVSITPKWLLRFVRKCYKKIHDKKNIKKESTI